MHSRRRLRWNPFVFLRNMLLLAAIFVLLAGVAVSGERPADSGRRIIVRQGDTLWGLASQLQPGHDPREMIYEFTRVNGLKSKVLRPGMVLVVP